MEELENYENVYRGRPARSWETATSYPKIYYNREVIRPLEIPAIHPLAEDNPPPVEEGTLYSYCITDIDSSCQYIIRLPCCSQNIVYLIFN